MALVSRWQPELDAAVQAARLAGRILLEHFGKAAVTMKGKNDPVTEADHAAQEAIAQYLRRRFPQDGFLGEESSAASKVTAAANRRVWIVDPLDGTINYVHGLPLFCTSIGLQVEGRLVVGMVYDPVRDEMFAAADQAGATCNGKAIRTSATTKLSDALVMAGLPTDFDAQPRCFAILESVSRKCRSMRRLGSAALALGYLACGRFDAFYAHQVNSWDVAGGVVLVHEAGGALANLGDFDRYTMDETTIVATNGLLAGELYDALGAVG